MTAPRIDHFHRTSRPWDGIKVWHLDGDSGWRRYSKAEGQLWQRVAEGKRRD